MDKKVLMVWFSRPNENYAVGDVEVGNTAVLGEKIIESLKRKGIAADTFVIIPKNQYPVDYQSCIAQATAEQKASARPEYVGNVTDFSQYSTVFLGYPIWWGDMPMIVYNFLEKHDFSNKQIIPFCTHEGSGDSGTHAHLSSLFANTTVLPGFDCTGSKARSDEIQADVDKWVDSLPL